MARVPQNWVLPQKVQVGTQTILTTGCIFCKNKVNKNRKVSEEKKKYPERGRSSNYPKAMLIVTTFQAETTFKDRSADRLRELFCLDTTGGFWLAGDRPLQVSSFFPCFNSSHKPAKIFMKGRRCKSIKSWVQICAYAKTGGGVGWRRDSSC